MTEQELIERSIALHPGDPAVYRDALAILYEGIQSGNTGLHAVNRDMRKRISRVQRYAPLYQFLFCHTLLQLKKRKQAFRLVPAILRSINQCPIQYCAFGTYSSSLTY